MGICDTCIHADGCSAIEPDWVGCKGYAVGQEIPGGKCKYDPGSRHYDAGGIETLDIIRAKLTEEQFVGFCLGNMIKYSCRANHKGSFDRDVEKVGYYSSFLGGEK